MNLTTELAVIVIYLLFLIGIGIVFKKFNNDVSDFFRCGARGTWWLVGVSMFMAGVSSATFTGNASIAYTAGWSILWIYVGGLLGTLVHALFLARWFRQLRLITFPEVVRERFDVSFQQFHAYTFVFFSLLAAGIQLWALAIFTSAVFNFPLIATILVLGFVVLFYSTSGGSWAVMATDFVQSMVMLPVIIAVAVLCLVEMGGFSGMVEKIEAANLTEKFAMTKASGVFEGIHTYAWPWATAMVIFGIMNSLSLGGAVRYFSTKDGRDASKSAWLGFILAGLGMLIWFIPPIAARLLFGDQVEGLTQLNNPADAAFAVAARNVLPNGLIGIIVVAMFSAAMSSIDTGINRNAAVFVRDIMPFFLKLLKINLPGEHTMLRLSRVFTIGFGLAVIGLALYLSGGSSGMFDIMMQVAATLGMPMGIPLICGLLIRRVPPWASYVSMACAFVPSIFAFLIRWHLTEDFFQGTLGLEPWLYEIQLLTIAVAGFLGFVATMPFYKRSSPEYRERSANFFRKMHTPVDFEKEVGGSTDTSQLKIIGMFCAAAGAFMMLLTIIPNTLADRLLIVLLAGVVVLLGTGMYLAGRASAAKENRTSISESPD